VHHGASGKHEPAPAVWCAVKRSPRLCSWGVLREGKPFEGGRAGAAAKRKIRQGGWAPGREKHRAPAPGLRRSPGYAVEAGGDTSRPVTLVMLVMPAVSVGVEIGRHDRRHEPASMAGQSREN
jgi:hypothetical protein